MPPIRTAVGPHSIRNEVQIDPGVSINMFPELGERETEFAPRPRLFQLSTHGYERFVMDADLPPVTGMAGSREADERLVVANGRTLRVFSDPAATAPAPDALTVTGHQGRRIRPVLGAAQVGRVYYWVCDSGLVRRQEGGATADVELPGLDVTPLGMACVQNAANDDVELVFFTCLEDRIIRCWHRDAAGSFTRQEDFDLDLGDTAVNAPESLWMDVANTTVGRLGDTGYRVFRRLLIVDAIGGRILEYELTTAGAFDRWIRSTPAGVSNPLDLQRLVGDTERQEPVVFGGIYGDPNVIRVADRASGRQIILDRATGVRTGGTPGPLLPFTGFDACGVVNGQGTRTWFVNGAQGDGNGRFYQAAGEVAGVRLPDDVAKHPEPTPLVPMGDDGRLMGWVVDRRLHVLDLREDRLVVNVEGNVDSLTYATGRLIAADASTGFLKVSPVDQIDTEPGERYGTPVAAASLSVPGWPRTSPRTVTSLFVGIRGVLVRTREDVGLWRYQRGNLDVPPVKLSGTHEIYGVCTALAQVAVIRTVGTRAEVRLYNAPPETPADYAAPTATRGFSLDTGLSNAHAFACDGSRLYVVTTGHGGRRQIRVHLLSTGAEPANSSIQAPTNPAALFDGLTFAENPVDVGWLRGIDFVDGNLLVAIRQAAPNPTVVRAFTLSSSGWARAAGRDLTTQASTDNVMLAHDANFVFDADSELVEDALGDGTPVRSTVVAAFRGGVVDRLSKYAWDPTQSSRTGAHAVAAVRRSLYAWTRTGMEIRDLSDSTQGFPYLLTATRTVGLAAPRSPAVVADVLHWLGVTDGGGLRVWRIGHQGDLVPRPVEGKAIEEMLTRIADLRDGSLEGCIGYGDDTGGHPTYVLHSAGGGISMAFDADAEAWHCRSSLRADPLTEADRVWPWLDLDQGAQRVTHSTTWRQRLICGGYTSALRGALAFASASDWRDIDQGAVRRVRQFGTMGTERRRVRFPVLRIDAVYGLGDEAGGVDEADPRFTLFGSDDGGKSFVRVDTRPLGPNGGRPPAPFYRLGSGRQRVYRLECESAVPFVVMGAFQDAPTGRVSRKV